MALLAMMSACGQGSDSKGADSGATSKTESEIKMIDLVTTQDGTALKIDAKFFDTPAAKEFITTGKNPYIGVAAEIQAGKKIFSLYSCVACHGGSAEGAVGPSLHGPNFKYAKNATNKGMFETIWHGTNGGMGAKGFGLMQADPPDGLTVDQTLKVIAWIRSNSAITGNE